MDDSGWERTSMMPTSGMAAGTAAHEAVEQAVVEWLREELDDPEITASDNFLDVGGHSLTFQRLNRYLSTTYGVTLDQRTTYDDELGAAVAAVRVDARRTHETT
ncbi:acyl carrier protein [Thermopolyspora sp. NPDC052614]|uniref:acyl carrier protein n=1 Tax=Thermopolyspora sp. NPDC052614 TaxID=3155682 RepID=UPI00341AABF4